ncbi:MAG: HDOD domain-containing protein, partial [Planctomycetota bacterium]
MSGPTLDALIASVGEMGTLPDSWHRIDEVVSRPSATTAQISDAISTDPALSARLLRLANSPLLGMTQRIDRLSQAVHLIGTRQIRELALATSVVDTLSKIPGSRERMQVYLLRSVSAGLVARGLAGRRREANVERFFVIGLLHHIGVLVLDMYAPESAQVVRTTVQATNEPSEQVELDVLGYDHAAVGAALLTRWKLPTSLIEPIAFHHKPYQAPTQRVES